MNPPRTILLAALFVATGSACPPRPIEAPALDAGVAQGAQEWPRVLDPEQAQREAIAHALAAASTDDGGIGAIGPKNSGLGHYGNPLGGWDDFERRLLAADPVVTGPLSPQTVRKVAHTGRGQLRYCFQADVFDQGLDLKGEVTVKFEISPAGQVSAAEVTQSTVGRATLESCVAGRVRTWSFPRRGAGTTVTYQFRFEP